MEGKGQTRRRAQMGLQRPCLRSPPLTRNMHDTRADNVASDRSASRTMTSDGRNCMRNANTNLPAESRGSR